MIAQTVEVEAHPFVVVVVCAAVNDIRRRRPDGQIQAKLFPAEPLFKACCLQQMPQLSFSLVDRISPS